MSIISLVIISALLCSCSQVRIPFFPNDSEKLIYGEKNSEEIIEYYKKVYGNSKNDETFLGKKEFSLIPGTLNLNGIGNPLLDSIVDMITKELAPDKDKLSMLPSLGDEIFTSANIARAEYVEENGLVMLSLKTNNIDVVGNAKSGASGFYNYTLEKILDVAIAQGLSFAGGRTVYDCCNMICNGEATLVIDKKSEKITRADYSMTMYITIDHASYKNMIVDKSGGATVTYKLNFPG